MVSSVNMVEVYSDKGVYLKSLNMEDADQIADNASDYEIARNIGGHFPYPYKRSDALAFIEYAAMTFAGGKEIHFGVHLEDGTLIGVLGFNNLDLQNRRGEIGYWIGKKYQGKGYGKKAVMLLLHFGFAALSLNRIYAITDTVNNPSRMLLMGLGFKEEGRMREYSIVEDEKIDGEMFGLLKNEYKEDAEIRIEDFDIGMFLHK